MDNFLPSYQMATSHDQWIIIAPYIASPDLCSAALVCNRWQEMFAPHLWGNPASHFGTENDAVYVALTRFKRTLKWARLYVRRMTHTFHLPPAHPEMYEGPHSDWLRDVLERLPNLQSLIVNGLPFFDHAALLTLRHRSTMSRQPHSSNVPQMFTALRFLEARNCSNATPSGLAEALQHFPSLFYLDLTSTAAAKTPGVLTVIGKLVNLQVLRLDNIGLRDTDIKTLTSNMNRRMRSLDLKNNLLTDTSIRLLLEKCFRIVRDNQQNVTSNSLEIGTWPSRVDAAYIGDVLRHTQDEELELYLRKRLTSELVERLAIEDTEPSGITHFYISGNRLTAEGVVALLRCTNIYVLDVGDVVRELPEMTALGPPPEYGSWESMQLPGAEKLIPIIAAVSHRMTYLRINHSILTESIPLPDTPEQVLPPTPPTIVELPLSTASKILDVPLQAEMSGDAVLRSELDSGMPREKAESVVDRTELEINIARVELYGEPAFHAMYDASALPNIPELPGDMVRMLPSVELPGDTVRMSRRYELIGSTSGTLIPEADDNIYADPSEYSWSSILSEQPTVSSFDDYDDESPSLIINATGHGLTAAAASMNGTSSPGISRQSRPSLDDNNQQAPASEWSWDSAASEKLMAGSPDQFGHNISSANGVSVTASPLYHTLDKLARRSTSGSLANAVSPMEQYGRASSYSQKPIRPRHERKSLPTTVDNDFPHLSITSSTPVPDCSNSIPKMPVSPAMSFHIPSNISANSSRISSTRPTIRSQPSTSERSSTLSPSVTQHRTYSSVISERRARIAHNKVYPTILRPSMLPHLRTLVLTSLPTASATIVPSTRLKNYITACAEEASLANLQAKLGYAMPPGQRGRLQAQREYARSLFALERIVLEIAPPDDNDDNPDDNNKAGNRHATDASGGTRTNRNKKQASWRKYPTKSSTEDADSERFWEAAQYDFSFFGDEECGQPATAAVTPMSAASRLGTTGLLVVGEEEGRVNREVLQRQQQQLLNNARDDVESRPKFDLVAEIAAFRRERKAVYEGTKRADWEVMSGGGGSGSGGGSGVGSVMAPVVAGYWEGEVKVVRLSG